MFCSQCAMPNLITAGTCAHFGSLVSLERSLHLGRKHGVRARWRRHVVLRWAMVLIPIVAALGTVGTLQAWRDADGADVASAYERAERALATDDLGAAVAAFTDAGSYRDAEIRLQTLRQPYDQAVLDAQAAFRSGDLEEAIALLEPVVAALPGDREASLLLTQASNQLDTTLRDAATRGENRGDWLAVERALTGLLARTPDDLDLSAELQAVQRTHAPLVFSRNGALYLTTPDRLDERLVTDEVLAAWPVWNPDRSQIAFLSETPEDGRYTATLHVIAPDGSGLRVLAENVLRSRWPTWSPDGGTIAYTSVDGFEERGYQGTISTRVVDLTTGQETDLTSHLSEYAGAGAWSPDGARLAVVSRSMSAGEAGRLEFGDSEFQIITVATGEVVDAGATDLPTAWRLAWSPVEDTLLVLNLDEDPAGMGLDTTALYAFDLATKTVEPIETASGMVSLPVWSPDGQHYAYTVDNRTVRIHGRDGAERWIHLPQQIDEALSWSPDGGVLMVPSAEPWKPSTLITLDQAQGQRPFPIIFAADWSSGGPPQWTPRTGPAQPSMTPLDSPRSGGSHAGPRYGS